MSAKESLRLIEKISFKYAIHWNSTYNTLWEFLIDTKYKNYISHYVLCMFNIDEQKGMTALKQVYYEIFMGTLDPKYAQATANLLEKTVDIPIAEIHARSMKVAKHLGYAADDPEEHKQSDTCKKINCASGKKTWSVMAAYIFG